MIEDLIDDGDIVVCRRQNTASNGDTVVALITSGPSDTGEATLKRFYQEPDQFRLEPRNPTMQPIFVRPNDLMIQGESSQSFGSCSSPRSAQGRREQRLFSAFPRTSVTIKTLQRRDDGKMSSWSRYLATVRRATS
jgi:repressor LexA